MDIDLEPHDVVNTCSRESRRQFWISFSIFFFICTIIYVCTGIFYTLYTMNKEMEEELERQNIKMLGIYDTCNNIVFNVEETKNEVNTTLKLLWSDVMLIPSNMYVIGSKTWKVLSNSDVVIPTETCQSVMLIWFPRFSNSVDL